jgi:hypothetical protein
VVGSKLIKNIEAAYDKALPSFLEVQANAQADPIPNPGNEFVFDNPTVGTDELPLIPGIFLECCQRGSFLIFALARCRQM